MKMHCDACLSVNRTLWNVSREHILLLGSDMINFLTSSMNFCWECLAILKKIKSFKEKVTLAQHLLQEQQYGSQYYLPESLSRLCMSQSADALIAVHGEVANIKDEIIVKQEEPKEDPAENDIPDTEYNCDLEYDYDNYATLTDIKIEDNPIKMEKVEKLKKNKNLYYRLIQQNFSKEKLKKKVRIKVSEIEGWIEKERNSDFFRKVTHKCFDCTWGFWSKKKFEEHRRTYHEKGNGKYVCDTCKSYFRKKSALTLHIKNSHLSVQECAICGYQCYARSHLNHHIQMHKKSIQCKICLAFFRNVLEFMEHYKATHRKYCCEQCGKQCKSKLFMEKHLKRHLIEYKCEICNIQYKYQKSLTDHMQYKHGRGKERAYCVPCGKQYSTANQYRRHIDTSAAHAHERPGGASREMVSCPQCGNTYSRRAYMMNHYRLVHEGKSNYYCRDCNKHYLNNTSYSRHRKYHHEGQEKIKNKFCEICGRGFAVNRTLINHMMTHTGERPFECAHCTAKFTQKHAMLSHIKHIHMKVERHKY